MNQAAQFSFKPAVRSQKRTRIALFGPAGSGKTFTALKVARGLVGPEGRIAVIDTERGSASMYANVVAGQFDICGLTSHSPHNYMAALDMAQRAGYDVVVVDSLSHAWAGKDGVLSFVDDYSRRQKNQPGGNSNNFAAWRDATPMHQQLIDALLGCRVHLVVTMRTKTEWAMVQDSRGKMVPQRVGLAPVQRDGVEYEFDFTADLDEAHHLRVTKSRFFGLKVAGVDLSEDSMLTHPDERLGLAFAEWIAAGDPTEPQTAPAREPEPPREAPRQQQPPTQQQQPQQQAPPADNPIEAFTKGVAQLQKLRQVDWAKKSLCFDLYCSLVDRAANEINADAAKAAGVLAQGMKLVAPAREWEALQHSLVQAVAGERTHVAVLGLACRRVQPVQLYSKVVGLQGPARASLAQELLNYDYDTAMQMAAEAAAGRPIGPNRLYIPGLTHGEPPLPPSSPDAEGGDADRPFALSSPSDDPPTQSSPMSTTYAEDEIPF